MTHRLGRPVAALLAGACAATAPTLVSAAALERAVPSVVRLLYEDGAYGELGASYAAPDLEGKNAQLPATLGGAFVRGNTGDLLGNDWSFAGALKGDINEQLSYILLFDQPYSANTNYRQGTFPDFFNYAGTDAELNTYQLSAGLAYDVTPAVKLYGGLRAQRLDASASLPPLLDYRITADDDWGWGGFVGAAYARPEIGLRVALTYQTKIEHKLDTTERATFPTPLGPQRVTLDDRTEVDTPQSVTLEAQTGVAAGTLVFGSIRWVDWSEFAIEPELYGDVTAAALGEARPLVDYPEDWWTYNLGVGRQLTEDLAGSFSVTYEPQVDEVLTTLGPVDGRTTLNAALSYDMGQVNVAGGLSYGWLGDTTNLLDTKYRDGTIFGAGLRVGYSF
jgi:long-subunit fatty acid transport protein